MCSLWIISDFLSIWDHEEISVCSLLFSNRLSSIYFKSHSEPIDMSLKQVKICPNVCNYCHNLFKKLDFTFANALWYVSAPLLWKIVPSCMCQFTGVFFHQNSTFSGYSQSFTISQITRPPSILTGIILCQERNFPVFTGDFSLISWSSSGSVSSTALTAMSCAICHRLISYFAMCLCGWRNKKLDIFEPSAVIMVLNYLINLEFSNLCWHNVTLKNRIWGMKVDFIIVHICLNCKRSFTIWSGILPQCTLDVLIFHHLSLHNGSSFHNLSKGVYWACIIVESAVHILLLVNSQVKWNVFVESWWHLFSHCIWSTLWLWRIRPLDCSWSGCFFSDIFSEVFWEFKTNHCCNNIDEVIWCGCISCSVFHKKLVKISGDKWW